MIELRWVNKVKKVIGVWPDGTKDGITEKVLQYRTGGFSAESIWDTEPLEPEFVWSEWKDVPTEEE